MKRFSIIQHKNKLYRNFRKLFIQRFLERQKNMHKYISSIFFKTTYNPIIPQNIFQTWHTKNLPPGMAKTVFMIKSLNPRFQYFLFDDKDCFEFIKNNFDKDVLNAYNSLIPGAYKADLWRYCVLYKKGGIYLDVKYRPLNNFRFINLTEDEHFVLDNDGNGIYNAMMVCKPGNELLLKAINKIVENVKNKFYGESFLEPTGPLMLRKLVNENNISLNIDLKHKELNGNGDSRYVYFKNIPIMKSYPGHAKERDNNSKRQHYGVLWKNRNIYA
jgi:mannosyltransferase OCH1-like enzyme